MSVRTVLVPLNGGLWVDVVISRAGTDRPHRSLLFLVGALR